MTLVAKGFLSCRKSYILSIEQFSSQFKFLWHQSLVQELLYYIGNILKKHNIVDREVVFHSAWHTENRAPLYEEIIHCEHAVYAVSIRTGSDTVSGYQCKINRLRGSCLLLQYINAVLHFSKFF